LALAQGLTGLLAVSAAVLTYILDRTRKKQLVGDTVYLHNLTLIFVVGIATALIAGLTWWTWAHAATGVALLFGLSSCLWLGVLFGGTTLAAAACAIWAAWQLIPHLRQTRQAAKKDP
jgi:hypothetical protein